MSNNHNKELLNRNAWEQAQVESVIENNKSAKYNDSRIKNVKKDDLKVVDAMEHS